MMAKSDNIASKVSDSENVTELHQRFPELETLSSVDFVTVQRAYADVLNGLRRELDGIDKKSSHPTDTLF